MPENVSKHSCQAVLHRFDVVKQHLLVTFRIHLQIRLAQIAFRIDHKTGAVPVHRSFVLTLAHARSFQELVIRIGKQIDRETKLVAETLVRLTSSSLTPTTAMFASSKSCLRGSERLSLDRAAGRVVLWIDVDDEPFAFEVIELNGLAVLVLEVEIYEALAFFQSHVLFPCCLILKRCVSQIRFVLRVGLAIVHLDVDPARWHTFRLPLQTRCDSDQPIFRERRSPAIAFRSDRRNRPMCEPLVCCFRTAAGREIRRKDRRGKRPC